MDSGDKASNKAMAVAMKYAMFQLFCIPTEEMRRDDPDRETPEESKPKMEGVKADTDSAEFRRKEWDRACVACGVDDSGMKKLINGMKKDGMVPDKLISQMTMLEYEAMIRTAIDEYGNTKEQPQ